MQPAHHAVYKGLKLVRIRYTREHIIHHQLARRIHPDAALWKHTGIFADCIYDAAQSLQLADLAAWSCAFTFSSLLHAKASLLKSLCVVFTRH